MTEPTAAVRGKRVIATRGWGDPRTVSLPVEALRGWCMATEQFGLRRLMPHHVLGAYLDGAVLDAEIAAQGVEFGRTGNHEGGSAGVLIRRADNPPSVYRPLRALGGKNWHTRAQALKRRAKAALRNGGRS